VAGLGRFLAIHQDGAGEDERLGALATGGEAAFDQQSVEALFGHAHGG
jgi:hypothetical protein